MVKPDQASISLGVVVEDMSLQSAQQRNAVLSSQIIDGLKKLGISEDDIQTASYTINPMYDYVDGKRVFRGYEVQHIFNITLRDISKVGIVIDTATQNGANVINNIRFTVSNPEMYYREALQKAVLDAIKKAEAVAKTLKVRLNKNPLQVVEKETAINQNVFGTPMLAIADAVTPIQEGQIRITSSVTVLFQYSMD